MGGLAARPGEVRALDARSMASHEAFREATRAEPGVPLLLKSAPVRTNGDLTTKALAEELRNLQLPATSSRHFFVGDQGSSDVMDARAEAWHPRGCSFGALAAAIAARGSSLYLTVRSADQACKRVGDAVVYDAERCADGGDALLRELVARAPMPLLLPPEKGFVMAFWMGSRGKNFGLHTDLFAEQFLVQTEGVKEVFLMLPEDAAVVAPFPFVTSEKFYKSELRSVANVDLSRAGCLRTILGPGDVLYIPPVWWHELRTISEGPSLTTTFRLHLEEDKKRFNTAVDAIYKLCKAARDQGDERLARHISSYFVHGAALPGSQTRHRLAVSTATGLVAATGAAVALLSIGFLLGRRSATLGGRSVA